ncbi:MAG TPA: YggS family pyridoxal phosphate-dependent enzyme [Flavobacteriales bacterium]|nr:YggS family pyridoxal phosphate-dependent enzyme [Flavobacteriales bacterium]
MMDKAALADRYARVKSTIPSHVKLIAVSKTRTVEEIEALYELGHRAFGENYPQELRDKHPLLPGDIEWHFIGNLQSNKVKYVAPFVHLVHTVDGARLLDELEKRASAANRTIDVLLQVHIAKEETKHGMSADEARELLIGWDTTRWSHIRPKGLMGMATFTEDDDLIRSEFEGLHTLFQRIKTELGPGGSDFTELSMGMSGDARIAIEAGSTMVRIGTAIFGDRG